MSIFSALAVIVMFINVSAGIYALTTDPAHKMNRLFFLQSLSLAVWSLTAVIIYSSSDKDQTVFWYKVSSFGFGFYYVFTLHLCLIFIRARLNALKIILMYIPALTISAMTWFSYTLFEDFIFTGAGWKFIPAFRHSGFYIYAVYYLSFVMVTVAGFIRWQSRAESQKEKHQSQVIVPAYIITVVTCTVTDFVLPLFSFYKLPALAPVLLIVNTVAMIYIINRYNFLTPLKDIFSNSILLYPGKAVVVNRRSRIISVNNEFCEYFGCTKEDVNGMHINNWFSAEELLLSDIAQLASGAIKTCNGIMGYTNHGKTHFRADCSLILDRFGDFIGILMCLAEMEDRDCSMISKNSEIKIRQVVSYINQNFTSGLSREGLAASVRMNPDHLSRNFNRVTGKRLDAYINDLRIMKAKSELSGTEKTVLEIAMDSGFENLRTFNRIFREIEGMTPSEYRENYGAILKEADATKSPV